jgi:hypothetical protein
MADPIGLLVVQGSFDFEGLRGGVVPGLDRRAGVLPPEVCPRGRVARWTVVLAPLSALLYAVSGRLRAFPGWPAPANRSSARSGRASAGRPGGCASHGASGSGGRRGRWSRTWPCRSW